MQASCLWILCLLCVLYNQRAFASDVAINVCAGTQRISKDSLRLCGGGTTDFGISEDEKDRLAQLREKLGIILKQACKSNPDFYHDDRLIRLLRTNQCDVEKTVTFFKSMLRWRSELDSDAIRAQVAKHWTERFWDLKCLPKKEVMRKYYYFEPNHAVNPEGDLVSVECTGKIQIRGFMKEISEQDIMRFWCYLMEWNMIKLAHLSRAHGRIARMVQIKDMEGLKLFQASCKVAMSRFRKINKMLHEVYPETLSQLIVINIPPMFSLIWRVFHPFLPLRTVRKMSIHSGKTWAQRDSLLKHLKESDSVVVNDGGVKVYAENSQEWEELSTSSAGAKGKFLNRAAFAGIAALLLNFCFKLGATSSSMNTILTNPHSNLRQFARKSKALP
uniref:CRAL-TRIO domain-containing protein n=1 Tax=Hanusia phi TaxID=3032 RepID=A0A7S0H766_9CRYP|mmetsp:Transcript_13373/g.30788  ORF Transcript_13373/g.30788 Transcript_13373/m.30788 type:complete len:388 (+) Transcript_13373:148-1311(+)